MVSEPYKLDYIRENLATQGTYGYNSLYLLSGPDAAYTQDPRVQPLDTTKDSIIQILNEYLTLQQISSICFTVLPAHIRKDQGDSAMLKDSTIWSATLKVSAKYGRNWSSV